MVLRPPKTLCNVLTKVKNQALMREEKVLCLLIMRFLVGLECVHMYVGQKWAGH